MAGDPRGFLTDIARCLRFYSRLPVPVLPWEEDPHGPPRFETMPRGLPVAGLVLGSIGAAVFSASALAGLGPWLSATLCLASLTWITGAFHEDGLADTADGFGGGTTRDRRIEIMRDSRIGSFGGAALILGFALRIGALATLAERVDWAAAAAAFAAAATLSRVAGLAPLTFLEPARPEGTSFIVGRPSLPTFLLAVGMAGAIAAFLVFAAGFGAGAFLASLAATAVVSAAAIRLSHVKIQGQTGDVAGATQQITEAAFLIGLLIATAA